MAAGSGEPPLNGRVALVTGSAQGIGQGIALRLAQAGASVVGVDLAPQPETAAQVRAADGKFTEYSLDITDDAEVARLVEGVDSEHGRLDILVNNAGIIDPVSFDDLDFARWRRVLEVNLDAPFRLIKAFVPFMRANGYGRVINIASGSVLGPIPLFVSYRASKMGVIGLTRALSTELGGDGITVNAVLPGITPTPMAEKNLPPGFMDQATPRTGIKRLARPEDIGAAIAFLASPDAEYITGQDFPVNGGNGFV